MTTSSDLFRQALDAREHYDRCPVESCGAEQRADRLELAALRLREKEDYARKKQEDR